MLNDKYQVKDDSDVPQEQFHRIACDATPVILKA